MPQPYRRKDLRALRNTLDARWPRLDADEQRYWVRRWKAGISPYHRVRSHAIRLQLDAVVALALRCGLRRHEIAGLTEDWMHHVNFGVVVWEPPGPWDGDRREVPYPASARSTIKRWLEFRAHFVPNHESPWLSLWSSRTCRDPIGTDAFNHLLPTYVGGEWSFRRFRDTCAVGWLNAGLPLEHLRKLLGLTSVEAVLPYAVHASGSLEARMARVEPRFNELVASDAPDGH